jgi:flagellar protein FliO/FliZ
MGNEDVRDLGNAARTNLPGKPEGGSARIMDVAEIVRYFGALALVLALVGAAGLAIRRYGIPGVAAGGGRRLQIVESLMLGKNHRILILRCDGFEHVVVTAPQGASVIATTKASPERAAA